MPAREAWGHNDPLKESFSSLSFYMSAQQTAIDLLTSLGFNLSGYTQTGRARMALPRTKLHASVGKRSVSIFRQEGGEAYDFQNFNTTDLNGIQEFILREIKSVIQ